MPFASEAFIADSPAASSSFTRVEGARKSMCHVTALTERRFEFLEYEKDFPVVAARLVFGFDINRPDLATVLSRVEVGTRPIMRVVETETDGRGVNTMRRIPRAGIKGVPSSAAPSTSAGTIWPCQCSCSGSVRVVVHFDRHWLTFFESH